MTDQTPCIGCGIAVTIYPPEDGWASVVQCGRCAASPTAVVGDPTTEALRRLRERVEFFCERIAQDTDEERDEADWPAVIHRETAYLVAEGPEAYIRYVDELDRHARRLDVDRQFRLIIGGLS